MTPQDVPGPLGLDWIAPWLGALADADPPQAPRAAGADDERRAERVAQAA